MYSCWHKGREIEKGFVGQERLYIAVPDMFCVVNSTSQHPDWYLKSSNFQNHYKLSNSEIIIFM